MIKKSNGIFCMFLFCILFASFAILCFMLIMEKFPINDQKVRLENGSENFDKIISDYCSVKKNEVGYSCLKHLSKYEIQMHGFTDKSAAKLLHHTFWRLNENKGHHLRVLILQILSFLATQDLETVIFIIWIQNNFTLNTENTIKNRFSSYFDKRIIQLRILNLTDLCSVGLYKKYYDECLSSNNKNSIAFSDFIRFLVLYKYGGIYTDGDVFYLRDMRPFWNKNFVHRWSFTENYNTAIMGLRLNHSQSIETVYEYILKTSNKNLVNGFYPDKIKNAISTLNNRDIYFFKDLNVYHSIIFDPAWLCNDGKNTRLVL